MKIKGKSAMGNPVAGSSIMDFPKLQKYRPNGMDGYTLQLQSLPITSHHYSWEKEHLPNLTGTPYAHKPKGLKGLVVRKAYEPWVPPETLRKQIKDEVI